MADMHSMLKLIENTLLEMNNLLKESLREHMPLYSQVVAHGTKEHQSRDINPKERILSSKPRHVSQVQQKIDDLKRRNSLSSPICFKCEGNGHYTSTCHNAILCFVCNEFGHKSHHCKTY
jgi:hypothetical protein